MKRFTVYTVLAAMLLTACGQGSDETSTQAVTQTSQTTVAVSETELHDNVPELDFGGEQMTFAVMEPWEYEFDVASATGEITNDATYNRNALMEERFHVVIDTVLQPERDQQQAFLRTSVLAGDQTFDVAVQMAYLSGALVLENMFLDWTELPYVELDQPWWVNKINGSIMMHGKLFTAVSDMCITSLQYTYAYLFNQQLAANYDVEDLYAVVEDGRWTLDYLYELTSSVYSDVDGNGTADDRDIYGLVTDTVTSLDIYHPAAGVLTLQETNGGLEVNIGTERAINTYEKVYKLFYENAGAYYSADYTAKHQVFLNSQALLIPIRLMYLFSDFRDMEVDYGILPFPKFDEEQEEYYNSSLDAYSVMMVPTNVADQEMVGALVEAMSFESMNTVMPAYYESALQGKYSRDAKSVQMLDLIMDSRVFDVSLIYNSFFSRGSLPHILRITVGTKDPYVSYYEKYRETYEKQVAELYESLRELGE